ncbi:kinase-like domain-containing protein [Rhizophagus irregularis DAOM 181602=DAOM 197198]|nr:kinase-like domain-containing protein [Rhizophagus irregularis DAOM 181602=DAOM 197198]
MNTSKQNSDTTETTITKTGVKNLWKECEDGEYQLHTTIFSTTESDEPSFALKRVNIKDLDKRKEVYGICGECNEPENSSNISNDFLNEIRYYISDHFSCFNTVVYNIDVESSEIYCQIEECEKIKENKLKNRTNENQSKNLQTHPRAVYTKTISSSSVNPISECLDCELNELDLNQDDDNDE